VPRQFEVSSVDFVLVRLRARTFNVTLNGKYAGMNDQDQIELKDRQTLEDLNRIRHILSKLPAAYGHKEPVAFTLTVDDNGQIVVPPVPAERPVAFSIEDPGRSLVPPVSPAAAARAELINLNTADATKLETLPWIGSSISPKIIAKRPFRTVDEFENVEGIGPAKMLAIKPLITV
jgi:DNA uptake protein ComE-like DNA-binding protein